MKLHLPASLRLLVIFALFSAPCAVGAVGSAWDSAWGPAGLEGAPDASLPQYQADIHSPGITALVAPSGVISHYDFGSYTAITLEGVGNAGAIIVGGASATETPLVGEVARNSWIAAQQGTYSLLIGGSYADNWQSGAAFNFSGNSHIMVDGATVSYIIGGNYKEGRSAVFTGNSYITVAEGAVTGGIVGATVVTHNANTSFTGNTNIFIYTPLADNSGPSLHSVPTNMIVGGFAWGTNSWKTQTLNGSTHVTVDLTDAAAESVEFCKHIVGGGFNGASGNVQRISGDTNVTVDLGTVAAAAGVKVVGGAWVNAGSASVEGISRLVVKGGVFNSWVVGGSWTENSATSTSYGGIDMLLAGGTFNGSVLGATYISLGSCTMDVGDVTLTLGEDAVLNSLLYGGYYINGDGSAEVSASLGDVSITLDGASVSSLVGGSYSQRNDAGSTVMQGDITLNLLSGSVGGDIYAAGQQDGNTSMSTASVTVALSSAIQLSAGNTISGGYTGAHSSSVITGKRMLALTDAEDYSSLAEVNFADFDVVSVPVGGRAVLGSLVSDSSGFTKSGGGSLILQSHSLFDSLVVEGGSLESLSGFDATALKSLQITAGGTLNGVDGNLAVSADGTSLRLELGTSNIGAGQAASAMINGLAGTPAGLNITVPGQVTLELSAEGVMDLLLAHRDGSPAVSSYLTLVDGTLTCAQPAELGLNEVLNGYGLRIAAVADGSLVVNGSAVGVYYVTADAATTNPHLVTDYPTLGLYSAVVIDSDQTLELCLPGDSSTYATINNLMGEENSLLSVENSSGNGTVTVVLSNQAMSSTGDLNYPDIDSTTLMKGNIVAGSGTELIKKGAGELTVNGIMTCDIFRAESGTLSLNGSGNAINTLTGSGGNVVLGGSLLLKGQMSGSSSLTVAPGAELQLQLTGSAGNGWSLFNNGTLRAEVGVSGTLTLGALTLGSASINELRFNTDGNFADSLVLNKLSVQNGVTITLTSVGNKLLRGGDYIIGRVLNPIIPDEQGNAELLLKGLPFAQLQPGSSYLYTDGAGNIILHAERSENNLLLPHAYSHNAAAGAELLWNSTPTSSGELASVYRSISELIASGDSAAANRAMAAVAGSSLASLTPALQGDVARQLRAIRNRMTHMGTNPCVVNEGLPWYTFWVQAESDYQHLSSQGDEPGYNLSRYGATLGVNSDVNDAFSVGMAFSSLWGTLKVEAPDRLSSRLNTSYFSAYARYRSNAWVHSLMATFGMADYELNRHIFVASAGYHNRASTDGRTLGFMYELLYDYRLGDEHDFSLQPLVQFSYRHSSVDGFAEHGSDAVLQANPGDMDIFTLAAGARLQAVVGQNMYNRTSLFECRALLSWDMGNRRGESRVALLHGSGRENVQGSRPGLLGAELGAGLTVPLGAESGSLFLDASITLRSRAYEVNAVAGYSLTF